MRRKVPHPFLIGGFMTIEQLFVSVDEQKPNAYDDQIKLEWLNDIEGKVYRDVVEHHIRPEGLREYSKFTSLDMSAELCVPDPYTNVYKYYLYSMIDFHNGEGDRYQNSAIMFNNAFQEFANYWCRTYPSVKPGRFVL